jgi:Transposase DDE domain group 1
MVKSCCSRSFSPHKRLSLEQAYDNTVLFPGISSRPVVTKFDQPQGSSDGGAILLRAADQRLRLTSALAQALEEERQSHKIKHELVEMVKQRVMAIACGYPDTNDAARLGFDPVHKLLVGRDPIQGEDLASQPTLSRFENSRDQPTIPPTAPSNWPSSIATMTPTAICRW